MPDLYSCPDSPCDSNAAAALPLDASPPVGIGLVRGLPRLLRGLLSWTLVPVFPLGRLVPSRADALDDPAREAAGLTLVLTGIRSRDDGARSSESTA